MKKKIFIAFSWTGMDQEMVRNIVMSVTSRVRELGYDAYVNLEDEDVNDDFSNGQYVAVAIEKLKSCDVLLALKVTKDRSEGQLMEIGAAKALGKPVILCMQYEADEDTYLDDPYISDQVIMWQDIDDLLVKLEDTTL